MIQQHLEDFSLGSQGSCLVLLEVDLHDFQLKVENKLLSALEQWLIYGNKRNKLSAFMFFNGSNMFQLLFSDCLKEVLTTGIGLENLLLFTQMLAGRLKVDPIFGLGLATGWNPHTERQPLCTSNHTSTWRKMQRHIGSYWKTFRTKWHQVGANWGVSDLWEWRFPWSLVEARWMLKVPEGLQPWLEPIFKTRTTMENSLMRLPTVLWCLVRLPYSLTILNTRHDVLQDSGKLRS